MLDNKLKENLSRRYVGLIAECEHLRVDRPAEDEGYDLGLEITKVQNHPTKPRIARTGMVIHLQLKSTTERRIRKSYHHIHYDLEIDNYNDLVDRQSSNGNPSFRNPVPLYLVLLILPFEESNWVNWSDEKLVQYGKAYWYEIDNHTGYTPNKSSIRIAIPNQNLVKPGVFKPLILDAYGRN